MPLIDHVLTTPEAAGMLVFAAVLMLMLCWPMGKELHDAYVMRRLRKQIVREHRAYLRRHAQFLREGVR
ncbi:MAG TPA: hypothetical protein VMS40_18515 [Vicinamibacterales bacterium]|nr:hypothetical protein [Vicinamibacterales bacterium]